MAEILSTLLGLLQGYLLVPVFQLGRAAGPWLANLWEPKNLRLTAFLNGCAVIAACLVLEVLVIVVFGELFGRRPPLGKAWGRGFVVGIFLFGVIPTLENRFRNRR